ncbi:glutathione S-transferase family protein [Alteromonas aestuariivivens]|uniref:Glutathione S-transferase family protein n=1 Tax=Alteromonas aestuariivivens TaxID=1938339 RepID=A0A3D8M8D7_9ALTE|nr:glutathione S-transferase family protein [Alteromonas aestuariivivens]RDV26074.1 glutathione S-transferase family protein [Alteromonas aestuariivivens]
MGLLVDGKWQDKWYDTRSNDGKFKRESARFRNWIEDKPQARFTPQSGRYHLYVSLACPWAHRTLIFRKLKQLEQHIPVSVVSPKMLHHGWTFEQYPEATGDRLYGADFMHELYTRVDPDITSRVTVPVLWDTLEQTIVSNESADIIRMFNSAFNMLTGDGQDFYPVELRTEIDTVNEFVYHNINNGVYKAGFATTQEAYEEAVTALFDALDNVERRLTNQRYLVGDTLTEADWRMFTTLIRFDAVYHGHFKCNLRRIADYPAIWGYVRELYQYPGVASTVNFDHIKVHYYYSHTMINPTQVVPKGPLLDLDAPHGRESYV